MKTFKFSIQSSISNFFTWWGNIIIHELPFIIIFLICILPATLGKHLITISRHELFVGWQYYAFAFMYAQILAYFANKSQVAKIVFYAIGIFLFFFFALAYLLFKACISPLIVQFVLETNTREACEFIVTYGLSTKAIIGYVTIGILVTLIVVAERYWSQSRMRQRLNRPRLLVWTGIVGFVVAVSGLYHTHLYYKMTQCKTSEQINQWASINNSKAMDAVTAMVYSFYVPTVVANEVKLAVQYAKKIYHYPVVRKTVHAKSDTLNVIYIFGESYIKRHASIYGYPLKTTPFMDEEQEKGYLTAFSDVVTPFNSTTFAQKNSFCCNSLTDQEVWYHSPFFPMLFKQAGYKVTFWDNQRYMDMGAFYTYSANSFFYDRTIMDYSYSAVSSELFAYDGELVDDFLKKEGQKATCRNLIMFHILGQHVKYSDRYPHTPAYTRFTKDDCPNNAAYLTDDKRTQIADYDNATYYNDCVIKKIATWYANKPTILIYMPDHGEEVYDYRDQMGRVNPEKGLEAECLKYQYEIPLVVWFSKSFMARHTDIVKAIRQAKDKPFMSDNICQILFHVSKLQTTWHRPNRCPLCAQYQPKQRIIGNGEDYDKIVKKRTNIAVHE